jgi:hypothetical protein
MAGRLKAMIAMLAKAVVHRDMGRLLWLGTIARISDNQKPESEISDQKSVIF